MFCSGSVLFDQACLSGNLGWVGYIPYPRVHTLPIPSSRADRLDQTVCITKTSLFKYTENFTIKKMEKKSDENSYIFHVSAKNIDCGYSLEPPRRGGSNEYPQYMFLSRNKKNNVYPCKPQFYYIKVGFKGVKII